MTILNTKFIILKFIIKKYDSISDFYACHVQLKSIWEQINKRNMFGVFGRKDNSFIRLSRIIMSKNLEFGG